MTESDVTAAVQAERDRCVRIVRAQEAVVDLGTPSEWNARVVNDLLSGVAAQIQAGRTV